MISILHTADWHLGKRLGAISRIEEQKIVLDEICTIADTRAVDAVVIAGDIFDTFNPPTEAIELLYATLKRLSNKGARPVIVIAGNHDSPDRIEAPNPLARDNGIIFIGNPVSTYITGTSETAFKIRNSSNSFIEIACASGQLLRIITAPFANEHRLQQAFMHDKDTEMVSFITEYWHTIANSYCDTQGVNILVGHHLCLPIGESTIHEPDDEKPIQAISTLLPPSTIPPHIQYVALGHLHRYQKVHSQPPIVYSGSPLAYSFSEAMQKKNVVLVSLEPNSHAEITPIELQSPLMLITKTFHSCNDAIEWLAENQNCYVELTIVSDTYLKPAYVQKLHQTHAGIVSIIPIVSNTQQSSTPQESNQNKSMEELFEDYFMSKKNGQKPSDEIKLLFKRILAQ
ncbi:MAG: Nuclease SbcCD subunit D [Bacteroidetes bacterium ADurb.Bin217]|nr:MAG: Nuclease SbcCD subunit D [Bacteroidetes bacterium ADurb.Bin217]